MRYNILIVEDDRQMAESLAAQVAVLNHQPTITYGARAAIQLLLQVIPDVIFMDINMPGVDGLEVLRYLRRDPTTANVPVIIVSAEDQNIARQAALDAGANYYIVKPPMLEDIEKALETVIKADSPQPTADSVGNKEQSPAGDKEQSAGQSQT